MSKTTICYQPPAHEDGPWLKQADLLIADAKKAREAGDVAASIALVSVAAECIRIHKNLRGID